MKICFVGLGSIGNRHLKNLYMWAKNNDILLDVRALRNTKNTLVLRFKKTYILMKSWIWIMM